MYSLPQTAGAYRPRMSSPHCPTTPHMQLLTVTETGPTPDRTRRTSAFLQGSPASAILLSSPWSHLPTPPHRHSRPRSSYTNPVTPISQQPPASGGVPRRLLTYVILTYDLGQLLPAERDPGQLHADAAEAPA